MRDLENIAGIRIYLYRERGWADHQDVVAFGWWTPLPGRFSCFRSIARNRRRTKRGANVHLKRGILKLFSTQRQSYYEDIARGTTYSEGFRAKISRMYLLQVSLLICSSPKTSCLKSTRVFADITRTRKVMLFAATCHHANMEKGSEMK
jgi:hypothetical protein